VQAKIAKCPRCIAFAGVCIGGLSQIGSKEKRGRQRCAAPDQDQNVFCAFARHLNESACSGCRHPSIDWHGGVELCFPALVVAFSRRPRPNAVASGTRSPTKYHLAAGFPRRVGPCVLIGENRVCFAVVHGCDGFRHRWQNSSKVARFGDVTRLDRAVCAVTTPPVNVAISRFRKHRQGPLAGSVLCEINHFFALVGDAHAGDEWCRSCPRQVPE